MGIDLIRVDNEFTEKGCDWSLFKQYYLSGYKKLSLLKRFCFIRSYLNGIGKWLLSLHKLLVDNVTN